MLRPKLLPTFQGVGSSAAGGDSKTATCELTLGTRHHSYLLKVSCTEGIELLSGNLIGEIRFIINGSVQQRFTGAELAGINALNGEDFAIKTSGVPGTAGYFTLLPLYLGEPWRESNAEKVKLAVNMAGIRSAQLEVDIKAGLTGVNLSGSYEWDPLTADNPGLIKKVLRQSLPTVGTPQDFNTAIDRKEWIQSIHLFATSDGKYVSKASMTASGSILHDLITTEENQAYLLGHQMNPDQSDTPRYDIVFDKGDPIDDALPAGAQSSLELHTEFNAAPNGNMVMLVQRVGPPENK